MRKFVNRTLLAAGIFLLAAVVYYGYPVIKFLLDIEVTPEQSRFKDYYDNAENPDLFNPETTAKWEGTERVNILLLGGDSRGLTKNQPPRSDTMMVASLDPVTKKTFLFSILRDTYADIPGHPNNRINAALALGGPALARETASELLGIPVHYYVYVDFQGFVDLIDALGGIEFEVEKRMYYVDPLEPEYAIDLQPGLQFLDGDKALQYVRFRHDARSDFARTERQRKLLTTIAGKLQETASLIRLPQILNSVATHIETDIPVNSMIKLAFLAYESDGDIRAEQVPPMKLLHEEIIDGSQVITVNGRRMREYVQDLFDSTLTAEERGAGKSVEG